MTKQDFSRSTGAAGSWSVWHEDDGGNMLLIQEGLSAQEADELVASSQSHVGRGRLWVSKRTRAGMVFGKAPAETLADGRRGALAALCALQLLGVSGAAIAAAVEVESILFSGPVFSLLGVALALAGKRGRSASLLVFGASAGAVSLFLFALINIMEWGPQAAELPVLITLVAYEALAVPLGLRALFQLLVPAPAAATHRAWQFNIQSLLKLTALVAFVSAVIKVALDLTLQDPLLWRTLFAVAIAFAVVTTCGMAAVAWSAAHRGAAIERRAQGRPHRDAPNLHAAKP